MPAQPHPALRWLLPAEALLFATAAALHLGLQVPLGAFTLAYERPVLPAAVAEGLIALGLALAAVLVFARSPRAVGVALAAQLFALGGVAVGLAITRGAGTDGEAHWLLLAAGVAGLAALLPPWLRATAAPPA